MEQIKEVQQQWKEEKYALKEFENIGGVLGSGDYGYYTNYAINANDLTNKQIDGLVDQGYVKFFGYVNGDLWSSAISIPGFYEPDHNDFIENGYKLSKVLKKTVDVPVDEWNKIDQPLEGNIKTLKIKFMWDRCCQLGYRTRKLVKQTPITHRDVINFVDNFYNEVLTKGELKLLMELDDDDFVEIAKDAYFNDESIKRHEFIGNIFFEGFKSEYGVHKLLYGT
jgi:hypothetical protein